MVTLVAIFAGPLSVHDPYQTSYSALNMPPDSLHWAGTDHFSRDQLARLMIGARISLIVGISAVLLGSSTGFVWGVLSGFLGGKFDLIGQRFVDLLLAFPSLILALTLLVALGQSPGTVIIAIGIGSVPASTRVIRSVSLATRGCTYVDAARAIGASDWQIMIRHIAPNCLAPWLVIASAGLGGAILAEASLSFLGLGVPPPTATWGAMLSGRVTLSLEPHWWLVLFPGLSIVFTVLCFNILGDAIRDVLDPKSRGAAR
jgi:peptide/nickel transport system permease protein